MTTRRHLLHTLPATGAAFAVSGKLLLEDGFAAAQPTPAQGPLADHFHRLGKAPSRHTIAVLEEARRTLPFADTRDFEEQRRGFVAPIPERRIPNDAGGVAWDMDRFNFIDQQDSFDSIHPSLHRIARLNNNYGLYEVIPGIYQLRGLDLANITFVRGRTGWIVFDVMITAEVARAAWRFFQQQRGEDLPISAVIYSHNHVDHWGGIRGLLTEEEVRARDIPIIAPVGFMRNAIEENVYAGTAMNRRLAYQYGQLLTVAPHGFVTQGLGQGASNGAVGLIAPNRIVERDIEAFEVDGVPMVFQNTPNTEAPSEMNTYIPGLKALWMAENVIASLHNIYTLRGAPVRDSLRWSKYIGEALYRFGQEAEVMFASHHWPRWGNARIQEVLRAQRDIYANMTNQVLHYANQGVTINQIHKVYRMPQGLQQSWHTRGYHGSPEHNARGVVQRFLGFWDCNPATLTNIQGFQAANADLTLTVDHSALEQVLAGQSTLEALIADGTARVQGDVRVLTRLASLMVDFDPRFEILPGTRPAGTKVARTDGYTATTGAMIPE